MRLRDATGIQLGVIPCAPDFHCRPTARAGSPKSASDTAAAAPAVRVPAVAAGGGGARGSLSLVMKSGVELQSVKSVSAKVRGFPTEHVPPSRLPILVLTKGRLRPEGTILSDGYRDLFRNTME